MPRPGRPWEADEVRELATVKPTDRGAISDFAERCGRSPASVSAKLSVLRVRHFAADARYTAVRHLASGATPEANSARPFASKPVVPANSPPQACSQAEHHAPDDALRGEGPILDTGAFGAAMKAAIAAGTECAIDAVASKPGTRSPKMVRPFVAVIRNDALSGGGS